MNLKDVQRVLKAKILVGEELMERPVETCCGSDLMSDVLAFTKCNTLLCTGLTNMQVIRTAGYYRFVRHYYSTRQTARAGFSGLCA